MSDRSVFVAVLRYLIPADQVEPHRAAHLAFLDELYAKRIFLASGKQVPPSGGVIIARTKTRQELVNILKEDPFALHNVAEYQIFEFVPTRYLKEFKDLLDS